MDIGALVSDLPGHRQRLADARAAIGSGIAWYPYDSLENLEQLDLMLTGEHRDLDRLAGGLPVADIGAADGDLAFVLERACGWSMEVIDTPATNMNGLQGVRALQEHLGSAIRLHDVDLDSEFRLPTERYGLVILLGILYHLKNPYYVLEQLSRHADHVLLSTRVARFAGSERTPIGPLPIAYLVSPAETNNDATNYWMFSPAGLERLVDRAGWSILESASSGDTVGSDPSSPEHDERAFMLLRSRHAQGTAAAAASDSEPGPAPVGQIVRSATRRLVRQLRRSLSGNGTARPAAPIAEPAAQATPAAPEPEPPLLCWPLDHFYSPVPDNRALMREPAHSRVFPSEPAATPGLDWRDEAQVGLLRDELSAQQLEFPDAATGDLRDYHVDNGMFSRLDAWMLQAMVRHFRPRRVIETGCGWSSLVTARVNREFFGGEIAFTCIEPYPPDFLGDGIEGISDLIVSPVEQVSVERFEELSAGDVLFIDTSHVAKTGGDVVFLYQEVLPRLAPGVVIHIHDIFLPWDYPEEWVRTGRAWNEQYVVRSFLTFNSAFEILLGVAYMRHYHPDVLGAAIDGYPDRFLPGGGSLWLRRVR